MKKILATLNMLLVSVFPSVVISNKKKDAVPTVEHEDNNEHHELKNILDEAMEMAIAARRVEEDLCYQSYGLKRPSDETRHVITMNADGTLTQGVEKNPYGQKFVEVSEKDREIYAKMKKSDSFNFGNDLSVKPVTHRVVKNDEEK